MINKGFYFDKYVIEDFLLTIKVNPFVMLLGNSGVGKTKLPILFSEYLSTKLKKEDIIINATNSLGKASSNKEWHLKRETLAEILPILPFEGKECPFTINDSFSSVGKFKLDPRFRFKDKKLINYLLELQEENPIQDLDLKIKVGERPVNYFYTHIFDVNEELDKGLKNFQKRTNNWFEDSNNDFNLNFLIFERVNKYNENSFLQLCHILSNSNLKINNNQVICILGCNNEDFVENFSSKFLDIVSTIELEQMNLSNYFSLDLNQIPNFHDLNYLEFDVVDNNVINLNINDLRIILMKIFYNGRNLWDLLFLEIDFLYSTFKDLGINISFRSINEILKFMIVSWKYEGKPTSWNNWRRYFDSQIKQKILPRINGAYDKDQLNFLLEFCGSKLDDSNENSIKYPLSFFKIKSMLKDNDGDDGVSFFNSFNDEFVDRNSYQINSIDDVVLDSDGAVDSGLDDVVLDSDGAVDSGLDDVVLDSDDGSNEKSAPLNYGDYIFKSEDKFIVNTLIDGEYVTFGKYDSFIDAKLIIDILIENEWNLNNINKNEHIYPGSGFYYVIDVINDKLEILKRFDSFSSANKYLNNHFSISNKQQKSNSKTILIFDEYRIDKEDGLYIVKKEDNPRKWGYFISIEDAVLVGDLLVEQGWNLGNMMLLNEIYFAYDLYWVIKVLRSTVFVLGRFESYDEAHKNMDSLVRNFSLSVVRNYSTNDLSKYGDNIIKRYGVFSVISNDKNYGDFNSLNDARVIKSFIDKNGVDLNNLGEESIFEFEDNYYCVQFDNGKFIILDSFDNKSDAENYLNSFNPLELFNSFNEDLIDVHNPINIRDEIDNLTGWEKLVFNSLMEIDSDLFSLNDLKSLDMFEIYQFEDNSLESLVIENLNELSNKGIIEILGNGYYKKVV